MTGQGKGDLVHRRAADLAQPADYVRELAAQLADMDFPVEAWLARHGLELAQLQDPRLAVPVLLFRRMVSDALRACNEPALGLLLGQRLAVHSHGELGLAVQACASLRQLVELLENYIGLRTPLVSLRHEVRGAEVRIVLRERLVLGDIRRPVLESILLALKNMLDFVALGLQPVQQVSFPFEAPQYLNLALDVFHCELRYRRNWCGLVVRLELFDRPLKRVDPDGFRAAARVCAREMDVLHESMATATRVRKLLLEKGTSGFPSLQVLARQLNLTPRTLHRFLVREGTSYRQITHSVRHALAVEHLQAGRLTVREISQALGYSDVANFRRAFKRQGSAPPSFYRDPAYLYS
jgi:AraC-like DNA-binding protein